MNYKEYLEFSKKRKKEILKDYVEKGMFIKEIAEKYGLSFSRVNYILSEFNAKSPILKGTKKFQRWIEKLRAGKNKNKRSIKKLKNN